VRDACYVLLARAQAGDVLQVPRLGSRAGFDAVPGRRAHSMVLGSAAGVGVLSTAEKDALVAGRGRGEDLRGQERRAWRRFEGVPRPVPPDAAALLARLVPTEASPTRCARCCSRGRAAR
jgi:hypothetical protein